MWIQNEEKYSHRATSIQLASQIDCERVYEKVFGTRAPNRARIASFANPQHRLPRIYNPSPDYYRFNKIVQRNTNYHPFTHRTLSDDTDLRSIRIDKV